MVNKLWFRELVRKWFSGKPELLHPRSLSEPRGQQKLEAWYLLYRWLIFSMWLVVVLCSILEIGSGRPMTGREKWPIYLTNWDLALGLTQAFLGVVIVSQRWRLQSKIDFDPNNLSFGKLERSYWFLYVVTSSMAVGVTMAYWALVHDPKIHEVDVLNILIHVCNSILMLLDFWVAGVPFEVRAFWWCPFVGFLYLIFTVVYYGAGGLDKRGLHCIYNVLDWEKPGRTLLVSTGCLIFLVFTHFLFCGLTKARDRLYDGRRRGPGTKAQVVLETSDRKSESCV